MISKGAFLDNLHKGLRTSPDDQFRWQDQPGGWSIFLCYTLDEQIDRLHADLLLGLGNGREGWVRKARQFQVVVANHRQVFRH